MGYTSVDRAYTIQALIPALKNGDKEVRERLDDDNMVMLLIKSFHHSQQGIHQQQSSLF